MGVGHANVAGLIVVELDTAATTFQNETKFASSKIQIELITQSRDASLALTDSIPIQDTGTITGFANVAN